MNYSSAIQFLYDLQLFGTQPGLETTFKLAGLMGNPERNLRFIHVAGTNGKGSTCAMLESIYRAAGLKVGLYTSPHLVTFGERIQINRQPISESDIIRLVEKMQVVLKKFPAGTHPTFFEVVTVMALEYFAEQRCDLVIWETGLGGRLDATNIVTPLASVITNIQLDHQKWLGDTYAQIAFEKAGIIKPGIPALTATTQPEALTVIRDTAARHQSPLTIVTAADLNRPPLDTVNLPLLGEHQKWNAALAIATVQTLQAQIPVSDTQLHRGLETVSWAGRLQVVKPNPHQTILLDGAHNVPGMEILREALLKYFPGQKPTLILGMLGDKDWPLMCQIIAPLADRIFLVPVASQRTANPDELSQACHHANPTAPITVCDSLELALTQTSTAAFLLLTGSIYLIGEALERLHLSSTKPLNERSLNEWSQKP